MANANWIREIKDAEFGVESSIAVREQYKTKLRALVNALQPSSSPLLFVPSTRHASKPLHRARNQRGSPHNHPSSPFKPAADASNKKQTRDALANRLRVRATMPAGKELQVLGDWLLLLRAASVNVVESIVTWRSVIHQARPLPYEVDHINYLLQMVNDVDFLDRCVGLVDWLGFRLVRNPFIVSGGLDGDDVKSTAVGQLEPQRCSPGEKKRTDSKHAPPSLLSKPLVAITPEDDVTDGSRIFSAMSVLTDEEAFYGRHTTNKRVASYLTSCEQLPPTDSIDEGKIINETTSASLFDEIAELTKFRRRHEQRLAVLQRERKRVDDLVNQLSHQESRIAYHRECDLVSDHRVWKYREQLRHSTLRSTNASLKQMSGRLQHLNDAIANTHKTVSELSCRLSQLVDKKMHVREERQDEKRLLAARHIERQKGAIRRKTLERSRNFKTTRVKNPTVDPLDSSAPGDAGDKRVEETLAEELSTAFGAPASLTNRRVELDHKRQENMARRNEVRREYEQKLADEAREFNRRRGENAQMFLEDRQAQIFEIRRQQLIREKQRRERVDKLSATPLYTTVQHIGGVSAVSDKKFRIAVYDQIARGYTPAGLQFVAYDPSTSNSFALLVAKREYTALGYGRTRDGLAAFCQWLCLVYERRKRQFKLVWSGSPCPPPLRIREYDHALVCVHKEGIRVQGSFRSPLRFVAAYIRTSDCSKLHFVLSSVDANADTVEIAVEASQLLPTQSMRLGSDFGGGPTYASWMHTLDADGELRTDEDRLQLSRTRVYSGETTGFGGKERAHVQIYDSSATEYELVVSDRSASQNLPLCELPQIVVLLKHHVNPYAVHLPNSAFGDLLDCIRLERQAGTVDGRATIIGSAVVLPTWRACLAKYVRALRMAKFGCRIDGVLHFVVVTLVQQNTEFRAHLLFEIVRVDDPACRQSLRISLSDLLRCPDTIWRATRTDIGSGDETRSCELCLRNLARLTHATAVQHTHVTRLEEETSPVAWSEPCDECVEAQRSRLQILRSLLVTGVLSCETDLDHLYYATCRVCGQVPPPVAIVVPGKPNGSCDGTVFDNLLRHFFTCFDVDTERLDDATHIRDTLEQSRICVLHVATPHIPTRSSVSSLGDQIREFLEGQPVELALVYGRVDFRVEPYDTSDNCRTACVSEDGALIQALQDAAASILAIAQASPVDFDAITDDEHDSIANFDGYLVSEALLVELTSVILHPDNDWCAPGETVGASSWGKASEFLSDPQHLSNELQETDIVGLDSHTYQLVTAYTAHPKWPSFPEDVRHPFRALLASILHIVHIQRLLDEAGGSVFVHDGYSEHTGANGSHDGRIYHVENGTTVIRVSLQSLDANHNNESLGDLPPQTHQLY